MLLWRENVGELLAGVHAHSVQQSAAGRALYGVYPDDEEIISAWQTAPPHLPPVGWYSKCSSQTACSVHVALPQSTEAPDQSLRSPCTFTNAGRWSLRGVSQLYRRERPPDDRTKGHVFIRQAVVIDHCREQ